MQTESIFKALDFFGFDHQNEISKRDIDLSYQLLKEKYKDDTYKLNEIEINYTYLKDIKLVNKAIRGESLEEKIEIIDNTKTDNLEEDNKPIYTPINDIVIVDRVSIFSAILSFILPLYGILTFAFSRRYTPKSAKWYLILAIIGLVANTFIYVLLGI